MIKFSATWNNCFTDFRSWPLVNRRFSKLSPPRWTAAWSVIFMNIPIQRCSRRDHSIHLLNFEDKCVVRSNGLSPCEALLHGDMKIMWPLSASSFNIPWFSWISGRNKFPCHFFLVIAPGFRTSKFPRFILSVAAGFPAASTINPPRYASFSFPWELDAASGFEFLLALASGFPVDALSIPDFPTQSDGSRMRNLSRQWKSGSLLRALILPQSCLLLFVLASSSPSFWVSWSSWNTEHSKESWKGWCWKMKKIVPLNTCEFPSSQHDFELVFGVNVPYLNLWVQINPIKQPIQSNSVGSWHVSHCWTSAFDYHLIYGFSVLRSTSHSTTSRRSHVRRLLRSRLTCLVEFWFFMWSGVLRDRFPCDSWPLDLLIWFGEEWSTSITKFQRSSAGIPSMRKPASREIRSASVELCETDVFFLHIQGLPQNQNLEPILICIVVRCFPHSNIVWIHMCDECKRSNALNVCHKL